MEVEYEECCRASPSPWWLAAADPPPQDKDSLMNALQASHDAHMQRIDTLEDRLVSRERGGA